MMSETSSSVDKPVRLRIASLSSNSWIKAPESRGLPLQKSAGLARAFEPEWNTPAHVRFDEA
jgi:hypothetical protein